MLESLSPVLRRAAGQHQRFGAIAQLGERVVRNDEVSSSILLGSTIRSPSMTDFFFFPKELFIQKLPNLAKVSLQDLGGQSLA